MTAPDVVVVDYGMGNLLSVRRAFERCGANVSVTADAAQIRAASRVVLPGVGAFANGMNELRRNGLDQVVREVAGRGTPLLGICLGMQMLLEESEEFGKHRGLGLVPGRVVPVPGQAIDARPQKIPHVGWEPVTPPAASAGWEGTVLEGLEPGEAVYFVQSFMALPSEPRHRLADCAYGGHAISAVICSENVVGCQFHPEKSGAVGLKVLRNFVSF
jgi:glutamine amidotransferase